MRYINQGKKKKKREFHVITNLKKNSIIISVRSDDFFTTVYIITKLGNTKNKIF